MARYDLGLSEAEYLDITPIQFYKLIERREQEQERQDFHAALICSVLANINRNPKKSKVFTPADFMPGQKQRSEKQSDEQMLDIVMALNALYGGTGGEH